jgi:HD superfamily phosphohydrolase
MLYNDQLYGEVRLPWFIEDLAATPQIQRLRNISQDCLPQSCVPWWKLPSRFEHDMAVAALSCSVAENNNLGERLSSLLAISSLLHDAGNAGLSHLGEPFLRQMTGKDGESFLGEMLRSTPASTLVESLGFSLEEVVAFVTGNTKPYSLILNGSMDIDNLDNVARYWFAASGGEILFNAPLIAKSYSFTGMEWRLPIGVLPDARQWQLARQAVYGLVYGDHLVPAMMVYRALYLAYVWKQVPKDFFRLDDVGAIEFLRDCNNESAELINRAVAHNWHRQVFNLETITPSQKLKGLADKYWNARSIVADYIREQVKLPHSAICAYVGRGRDKRRIDVPFVVGNGEMYRDKENHDPIYRVRIFVAPEFEHKKESIEYWARYLID